jgi:hypothetical protein
MSKMSKTKSKSSTNAITSLKADHQKVKGLFDEFEKANDRATKMTIVSEALEELSIHATLEEEIFYPAVRQEIDDEDGVMNEADEEHHVAKILIAELEEKTEIDFDALGEEMLGRKDQLMSESVPVTDEADMVANSKGHGDSPAEASTQTATPTKKRA